MFWTALGGAGIVQRMGGTNHSQMVRTDLFPLQWTDSNWGFEAMCLGNSNWRFRGCSPAPLSR